MGKKVKKKARSGHKEKRVVSTSQKSAPEHSNSSIATIDAVVPAVIEKKLCPHIDSGLDLVKVSSKIGFSGPLKCEDCREESVDRRAGKAKGNHGKKKGGSEDSKLAAKAIWVCLKCGHFSCGGAGFPTTPQSHAVRHARQNGHHLAIQFKNLHLRWCFPCSTLIPVDDSEENGQPKDVLFDIVKVIKAGPSEGASVDVEDVWFGSGSVKSEIKSENTAPSNLDGGGDYVVRGFVNLGNTCFFNSILQNLMAMGKLRDHFLKMDGSVGPLTVSLKKLFVETNPETGYRSVINPKSFFGCVCAKFPQFRGFQQHDSHELLRCLLDGLSIEESSSRKQTRSSTEERMSPNPDPTFVDAIFGGELSSAVSCLECEHSSIVYEPFLDLSLPIPTKRPPSKKAQPITRPKKPKLPPRRSQRIRSKVNESTDPVPSHSIIDSSNGEPTTFQVQSTAPIAENMITSSVNSTLSESIDQTVVGANKVSTSQNLPATEGFDNNLLCKNVSEKTLVSVDDTAWLDYLESDTLPNDHDMAAQINGTSLTKDAGNEDASENDVLLQNALEFGRQDPLHFVEQTVPLENNLTWMDYLEPASLSDDPEMTSQINDISGNQDIITKDAAPNNDFSWHSSESSNQVFPKDSNLEMDWERNSWEDETPLQVQSSEVLLLPYKEDTSTNVEMLNGEDGVTTSPVGYEQDSLDFGDFGDLFNEPEDAAGPTLKPHNDKLFESYEVVETGITVRNSSGSDLDEIDNTDSPVSVERCLSYFTKAELLSKNEHAWHCENCSKALVEQRKSSKNLQNSTSKVSLNGGEDRIRYAQLGSGKDFVFPIGSMNLSNGNNERDVLDSSAERLVSCNGNIDGNLNCTFERNQKAEQHVVAPKLEEVKSEMNDALQKLTCNQDSSNESCSVGVSSSAGCYANIIQQTESQSLAGEHESEGGEDEEVDSESIKVKRDATKRILIDKAPPILTIHLKRFRQDAHGRISKLNGHVVFKNTIDLRPYMHPGCAEREKCKYRLLGVVEHLGSMGGGHYVAYMRGGAKSTGKAEKENGDSVWYYTSDAYVREVSFEEVLQCEAYILFYEEI